MKTKMTIHFKIAIILLDVAFALLIFAVICTVLANDKSIRIFSLMPNDVSTYSGMLSCLFAVVGVILALSKKVKKSRASTPDFEKKG
ncbi:MAG: hypothetical protein ACI4QE_03215 [Acutalibacteraceae bacterium]